MKSRNKIIRATKVYLVALTIIAGTLSSTTVAFANVAGKDVENYLSTAGTNGGKITVKNSDLKDYLSTQSEDGKMTVTVNGTKYYYSPDDEEAIQGIINPEESSDYDSSVDDENLDEFKSISDDMGIKADVGTASQTLSGFKGIINTFLGTVVVVSSMGIMAFTGLDICYIIFPVLQNKCEESRQSGGAFAGKTTADGDTKLKWVSDDAVYALKAAATVESGKNPLIIYAKKRAVMIIVLGVVDFIFLTGNMTILTDVAINLASGVLKIIQKL